MRHSFGFYPYSATQLPSYRVDSPPGEGLTLHPHMPTYRVHQFAELAGVTVKALRYYDRLGLLRPMRSGGGGRLWGIIHAGDPSGGDQGDGDTGRRHDAEVLLRRGVGSLETGPTASIGRPC